MRAFLKFFVVLGLLAMATRTVAQDVEEAKLTGEEEKPDTLNTDDGTVALAGAKEDAQGTKDDKVNDADDGEAKDHESDRKDDGEAKDHESGRKDDGEAKDHDDDRKDDGKHANDDEHSSHNVTFIECDCKKNRVRGTGERCSCADLFRDVMRHTLMPWEDFPGFFPPHRPGVSLMQPRLSGRQRLLGIRGGFYGGYYPGYGYGYPGYGYGYPGYGFGYPGYGLGYPGYGFGGFGPGIGVGIAF
ncbi:conserved hypothetical protein [Neospora caninum Liverpool]|uniref:Uncharacterized protein n=1 Tax=Neospora caninum (strain Liverpool) TaxID=572307 RepID=F0VA77_NEOCL|nr:conserved hypothetical protein [Neospora caninum Liverpool]CBZ50566.1 conserved hypothetical protein [Neospora caninum Liverpool]CEL65178.1 TPA: hypothetical protein BN1204_010350 [Neospora caninum Liverpool]|eukprot:XP_003880599.1 conserved hypothetical protein [Neospora caninum Liverpool]